MINLINLDSSSSSSDHDQIVHNENNENLKYLFGSREELTSDILIHQTYTNSASQILQKDQSNFY